MGSIRKTALWAMAILVLWATPGISLAAVPAYLPYPSANPVILNPYGETDEAAQLINAMRPVFRVISGRSLEVVEMPGRGGASAWGALVDKEPDGYSMSVINLQSFILRGTASRPVFRLNELFCTNVIGKVPLALWVPVDSPFPSLKELLRSARAYPGQLVITGAGSNSQTHLLSLRLNFLAGIKTVYLPFIGTTTAMEASRQRQSHAAWGPALPEYGRSMGMRALAVTSEKRLPHMPDTPSFEENQVGLFETAHFGLILPHSTPPGTRQLVSTYFHRVVSDPGFKAGIMQMGFIPMTLDITEAAALMKSETERLTELKAQFNME